MQNLYLDSSLSHAIITAESLRPTTFVFQELFESPSVVRLLKSYQNKILATNSHPTTTPHSMSESQLNTSCELIRQPAEGEY